MNCPLCGYKYVCPCDACKENKAEDITLPRWKWFEEDGMEACPVCGLYMHMDFWLDVEVEQMKPADNGGDDAWNTIHGRRKL